MDVLFDSIDVRDLLSTPDVDDPSTPLSAPDLRLLIDRLQVHSLHIKSRVQNYIRSHHSDFSTLFSQCSDVVSQSDQLSAQLFGLLSLISENPIDAEIKVVIQDIVSKSKEVREKRELLDYLGIVLEHRQRLRVVEEDIRCGKVVEAAESLIEQKEALRLRDNDGTSAEDEGRVLGVYQLLTTEWSECFEKLQEILLKFMEKAVQFDRESNKVRVKYHLSVSEAGVVELQKVLKAMEAAGILHYGLAKVADLMIKHVISPAISRRHTVSFIEEIDEDRGQTSEAVLSIISLADPSGDCLDGAAIYHDLTKVVEFINKSLCYESEYWMHCFGRLTWPRMSDSIISNFLSKVVPDDASKLADFQKVVKLSSDFEVSLKELKFISSSDSKDDRLSVFTDNVEVHFAARKRIEILAKARYMLLQASFSIPQEIMARTRRFTNEAPKSFTDHVVNLLFTSENCVVSDAALKLMELVHKILKDVCLSSPRVALEFYNATRDAILLYEAVIPVKLERQLDTINQAAVLIHNDCHYLSQEILGLSFQYRPDFPSILKELAVFVDLTPRFQMMAEEILERQIKLVVSNLTQAIDSADGFQNTHLTKQYESAKFSIDQVAFILEKVHIIWEPLLMPSVYKRSMSLILEVVFSRIVKDILLLDDMAAEETVQLQRLIHLLFENLSSILESLSTTSQTTGSVEGIERTFNDLIPSLKKARKLEDLLDMPLKSITSAWESRELINCGFTLTELEDFIMAIFTDSPLRKECLMRIENSAF